MKNGFLVALSFLIILNWTVFFQAKKQKRNNHLSNQKENGRRTLLSQIPHEKNRTTNENNNLQHRPTNQNRNQNLRKKFFQKLHQQHRRQRKKIKPKTSFHPRQQKDVPEAAILVKFLNILLFFTSTMVKIGIIGGTGVYDPNLMEDVKKIKVHTPFGKTSDFITTGMFQGKELAVIPRHGSGHRINPSNVNYRANIWALKSLGVTHILASSAVGSLKEEYKPGELVLVDQFIDRTYKRKTTFYEGDQVCHISTAEPFCPDLRQKLKDAAEKLKLTFHEKGTCIVVEGPRFSTKAESMMFKNLGLDIIGMTMHPEATLAREAEICYATVAMVTDYDCWHDKPVDFEEVIATMKDNVSKVKDLFTSVVPNINDDDCRCRHALKTALI